MKFILLFLEKYKNFLVFLLLFFISFLLIVNENSYQRSKYLTSANWFSAGLFSVEQKITSYFSLSAQNELLAQENMQLREEILRLKTMKMNELMNATAIAQFSGNEYKLQRAEVIKNSYHLSKNYILIGKGESKGVKIDMGVVSSKGIVGIVDKTTANYSLVQSVLNKASQISVALKKTGHFGTLQWNGLSPEVVQLTDISSTVTVNKGDTIITGGYSSIFPKGIPVGAVQNIFKDERNNSFRIDVKLFADMTNLQHLYIIENKQQTQIKNLELQ